MTRTKSQTEFKFPRETLLIEIERRCTFAECGGKNQVGLTKTEAFEYRGFDCTHCEQWNDDRLSPKEMPESWLNEMEFHQSYEN